MSREKAVWQSMNQEFELYVPKSNEETNIPVLHALVEAKPLGAWSTIAGSEIVVNHIPFLLHKNRGEFGTLVAHVARSNNIWHQFSTEIDSVVVFHGEQAYITPSWYPGKHEHGKTVPTWNCVVVHAHGRPTKIENPEWLLQHINELSDLHESGRRLPWKVSDAPAEFTEKLIGAIVGIEIPITKLTGKWKLGQNRPEADMQGMIAGLRSTDDTQAQVLAERLNQHLRSNNKG